MDWQKPDSGSNRYLSRSAAYHTEMIDSYRRKSKLCLTSK
jgi:hypothetical protein